MARPTKPGNSERGWNDPPVFLYNTGAYTEGSSTTTSKRSPLTKRIVHMETSPHGSAAAAAEGGGGGGGGNTDAAGPQIHPHPESTLIPPPASSASGCPLEEQGVPQVQLYPPTNTTELPQFAAPIIVPTMAHSSSPDGVLRPIPIMATNPVSGTHIATNETTDVLQIPNFDDDEQMFHYVITRLQRALKDCQTTAVDLKIVDDIQKKVNILSDMWKNGKVSYPVKSTMARLSTAIHRRECGIAQQLHLALMIDHVSEVSKWLVGIKRLIQEVEKVEQQPLSPSFLDATTLLNSGTERVTDLADVQAPSSSDPANQVQEEALFTDSTELLKADERGTFTDANGEVSQLPVESPERPPTPSDGHLPDDLPPMRKDAAAGVTDSGD